ncbi:MAG: helix-turn-helix transcriptional regulator [archaeon]|nr:helix-turn-helix transcriptional regulator [archaeon]
MIQDNFFKKTSDFVAKKHNIAIIRILLNSTQGLGFNSLMKQIFPITPRILSTRLAELEKEKLIQKNLVLGDKPKVEYRALPKAQGLAKAISELEKWGKKEL